MESLRPKPFTTLLGRHRGPVTEGYASSVMASEIGIELEEGKAGARVWSPGYELGDSEDSGLRFGVFLATAILTGPGPVRWSRGLPVGQVSLSAPRAL